MLCSHANMTPWRDKFCWDNSHKATFTFERLDFRLEFGEAFGFPDRSIQFARSIRR
jgi:hypothetical protein